MKKMMVALFALLSVSSFAQKSFDYPKNEVKINILNAIAIASIEVGYERFVGVNQSVEAELFFNDRFSYFGKGKDYKCTSIKVGYNYYFDLEGLSGPFVNPFVKQRFGTYQKDENTSINMDSFILGIGVGYIWNYNDTFVVAPFANIGRNFSKAVNDEFWAIEPNAGVRIGYRF